MEGLLCCVGRRPLRSSDVESEAQELVRSLQLEPLLPEGGFFRRTHYSDMKTQAPWGASRASNAILYLMLCDNVSKIHRLKMDETWHFYHGSPIVIVELDASVAGQVRRTRLGPVIEGLCPQYTVSAGTWFGAYPEGGLSLVGCTCGPAFEFEHFELGRRSLLLDAFPDASDDITRLCAGDEGS
ncbi:unnamed protein product [Polarella glacialis]|uniref:DUF985 domain-containing protein n=1 Tax=Polarella glacialis TaxID=89957 RepID=A0A813ILY6_POLGL|nr:unnamed protein product [Polarella glacialis]CAE8651882.1 unnamed protein product [Polarella glacialis]